MEARPPSTSTSKVSKQSIDRAVKALVKWKSKSKTLNPNSSSSDEDDEFIYLILTLIKPPLKNRPPISNIPHTIPLPNPVISPYSRNFNICLLVKDRYSLFSKQKIESELLPISNVVKLSKFRSDYTSFEAKKKFCDSYDAFLADKSVIPELPKLIGRYFYKRRKNPIGIELARNDWKEQIETVFGSASLVFRTGTCSVVKVARESMGREKIVENVIAAVDGVVGVVPKKWKNVKCLHLKFKDSLALPIYGGVINNGDGEKLGVSVSENFEGLEREEEGEERSDGTVGKKRKKGLERESKVKQDEVFL